MGNLAEVCGRGAGSWGGVGADKIQGVKFEAGWR